MRSAILAAAAALALAAPAGAQAGKLLTIVDANVAGEKELTALPHFTPALVKATMEARPFLSPAALDAFLAKSLTPEQRKEVYGKAFVQLDLNSATREEILLIPNSGNRVVREFMEYRPYKALAVFDREMGKYWGKEEVARLAQYVFVPIDLNTASDEDILTIPGVGARMLREFKEYRPYKTIEQFRREIGKYVNEKEVARLERYVVIR